MCEAVNGKYSIIKKSLFVDEKAKCSVVKNMSLFYSNIGIALGNTCNALGMM